ncbi:MAG: tyrosine-type recombinase/integrase [Actinomycetota bacterium]
MPDAWDRSLEDLRERLATQGGRRRHLAPRTRDAYLADARLVAQWLRGQGVPGPERVTVSALEAALRELRWSTATRARAVTALREWLAPHHPPNRSPADLLERPRVTAPPVPRLSQPDADTLLQHAAAAVPAQPGRSSRRAIALRDRAMLEVLYGSGLRRQELCDVVLSSIDWEHETVRIVGKGARPRTVPLTEPAVDALRDWLIEGRPVLAGAGAAAFEPAGRARVFVSRTGRPLDGSTVYRVVSRALRGVGRGGGPHLLRHAAGTHLLEGPGGTGGAHLRVVQEVLGHASIATTQRYTGVTTRAMQQALRRAHPRG